MNSIRGRRWARTRPMKVASRSAPNAEGGRRWRKWHSKRPNSIRFDLIQFQPIRSDRMIGCFPLPIRRGPSKLRVGKRMAAAFARRRSQSTRPADSFASFPIERPPQRPFVLLIGAPNQLSEPAASRADSLKLAGEIFRRRRGARGQFGRRRRGQSRARDTFWPLARPGREL